MSISEEIRKKFKFPKTHEHIVCLVDGKPMELPLQLKRYMAERFGKPYPNYIITKKPYDKVVYSRDEFIEAVKELEPRSNILFWDESPYWFRKQIIKSDFARFWELIDRLRDGETDA